MAKGKTLGEYIEKWHVKKADWQGEHDLEVLGVSNVDGIVTTSHVKSDDLSGYLVIEPNTFAYNPYRINVGSVGLTPNNVFGVVSPAYIVFKVREGKLIPELLLEFLKSFDGLQQINKYARGTVRKALRFEDLCKIQINFPSYEEQKIIFNKKLLVEKKQVELSNEIQTQKQLISQLKQSILQEAIQGKLTEVWRKQNPDVEPASVLLKRIKAEKAQLIKDKKIKKEKPLPPITEDEIPFEIPENWSWCRLGEIAVIKSGKRIHKADYRDSGVPFLRSGEIGSLGRGENIKRPLFISKEKYSQIKSKFGIPKSGDILIACIGGSIGNTWIVDDREFYFKDGNLVLIESTRFFETNYLLTYLKSRYFWNNTILNATDSSYNALTIIKLNQAVFPLPPLEEQKAIVEKVETLIQKCNALEREIAQSEQHANMLMQAVLKEAFESKQEVVEV